MSVNIFFLHTCQLSAPGRLLGRLRYVNLNVYPAKKLVKNRFGKSLKIRGICTFNSSENIFLPVKLYGLKWPQREAKTSGFQLT